MNYSSLSDCLIDLEKHGHLIRIKEEVDPNLEMAAIHHRVFAQNGPAILFENVKGSPFQAVSNIYGTKERTDFIFRNTVEKVKKVIDLKIDFTAAFKSPLKYLATPITVLKALPRKKRFNVPVLYGETTIDQIPQIKSWKDDGGAFITLSQVFSLPAGSKNIMESNLGMYRIQLSGNDYVQNEEIGLHYQLHRGIGVHHKQYNESDELFRVSIFVGGPPSHTFAAVMPLPEGISELTFAGMLGNRRFRYTTKDGHIISSDADFVIVGTIDKSKLKSEGPFGDHIGYYSLAHDFPYMKVEKVYHRKDAIWPFTVVGRPPAEDSSFGYLIHKLVDKIAAHEFPGVSEINAVDEAGVHPLLLAVGSERYMPFRKPRPEEIITQAYKILGTGQTSLAKYLMITTKYSNENLNASDLNVFFKHVLERADWKTNLHFQTKVTIDTLDYSGDGWNAGSKLILAVHGEPIRELGTHIPNLDLPDGFSTPTSPFDGVLIIQGPKFNSDDSYNDIQFIEKSISKDLVDTFPLIVVVDESVFTAENMANFVWVTFTRSNPSHDIYGVDSFSKNKHWGCNGSLIIDARIKPHHAPPLLVDEGVEKRVDEIMENVKF